MNPMMQQDGLILHIGHDPVAQTERTTWLRSAGMEVIEAAGGPAGVMLLRQRAAALVLLDGTLPSIDGQDVGRYIKAEWPHIIVLKANHPAGVEVRLDDSADCTLTPQISARELVAVTAALLRLHAAEMRAHEIGQWNKAFSEGAEDCAILTCGSDGCITGWNVGAESIFGWERTEIVGQRYAHLFDGVDVPIGSITEKNGHANGASERWHRRRDGTRFWAHSRTILLHDRLGAAAGHLEILHDRSAESELRGALATLEADLDRRVAERTRELTAANERLRAEIAERERSEARMRQSQTLEALGRLTAGLAHDFNNLLTAILGGLEVLRLRTEDPRTLRLIDSSTSAANRGAKLIAQLTAFARKQKLNVATIDLNTLVSDMREIVEQAAGRSVTVVLDLDQAAWPVLADADQLRMALLNLSINTRETMKAGGALQIATGNHVVTPAAGSSTLAPGDYGTLSVHDSGSEMSQEALDHIFEPFFATKDVGSGSGMDLAQVHGFVRQSGGDVLVSSKPREGTSLTILLPRAPDHDEAAEVKQPCPNDRVPE